MNILLLSPYPERLLPAMRAAAPEDRVLCANEAPGALTWALDDLRPTVVCYGYRHILPPEILAWRGCRFVNLHIGLLPWNRGADPVFWSWYDDTPKGVSIHEIDEGLDTGPLLAQWERPRNWEIRRADWSKGVRLEDEYAFMRTKVEDLFLGNWPSIRKGKQRAVPQMRGAGSFHRKADREAIWHLFPAGWDTPVSEVERMGREAREKAA